MNTDLGSWQKERAGHEKYALKDPKHRQPSHRAPFPSIAKKLLDKSALKINNRTGGINKATDSLTKEEVEPITELSSETLDSYKEKAKKSSDSLTSQGKYRQANDRTMNVMKATGKQMDKTVSNIRKALNRESVVNEVMDEPNYSSSIQARQKKADASKTNDATTSAEIGTPAQLSLKQTPKKLETPVYESRQLQIVREAMADAKKKDAAKKSAFGGGKFPQAKRKKLKESVESETLYLRSIFDSDLFSKMKELFRRSCHGGNSNTRFMETAYTLGKVDMEHWGDLLDEIEECIMSCKDSSDKAYLKEIHEKIKEAGTKMYEDQEEFERDMPRYNTETLVDDTNVR
jgi:predicted hydrocarbon binding protein